MIDKIASSTVLLKKKEKNNLEYSNETVKLQNTAGNHAASILP